MLLRSQDVTPDGIRGQPDGHLVRSQDGVWGRSLSSHRSSPTLASCSILILSRCRDAQCQSMMSSLSGPQSCLAWARCGDHDSPPTIAQAGTLGHRVRSYLGTCGPAMDLRSYLGPLARRLRSPLPSDQGMRTRGICKGGGGTPTEAGLLSLLTFNGHLRQQSASCLQKVWAAGRSNVTTAISTL